MKKFIRSIYIIALLSLLFIVLQSHPAIANPEHPIPNSDFIPKNLFTATMVGIICFSVVWLIARYLLIHRDKRFINQSKIKNVFYELKDEKYHVPDINFPAGILIAAAALSLLLLLIAFINSLLNG